MSGLKKIDKGDIQVHPPNKLDGPPPVQHVVEEEDEYYDEEEDDNEEANVQAVAAYERVWQGQSQMTNEFGGQVIQKSNQANEGLNKLEEDQF